MRRWHGVVLNRYCFVDFRLEVFHGIVFHGIEVLVCHRMYVFWFECLLSRKLYVRDRMPTKRRDWLKGDSRCSLQARC